MGLKSMKKHNLIKYLFTSVILLLGFYVFVFIYDMSLFENPYRGQLFHKHEFIKPKLRLNDLLFHFQKKCFFKRGRFPCDYHLEEDAYIHISSTLVSAVPARLINTNIYFEICEMSKESNLGVCIDKLKSDSRFFEKYFKNILNTKQITISDLPKFNLFKVTIDSGINFLFMYPVFGIDIALEDNSCGNDLKCLDGVKVKSLNYANHSTMMIVNKDGEVLVPDYLYRKSN